MNNKQSHLYNQCVEMNHTEKYLGSYQSIGDIKWMKENVINIGGRNFESIENELKGNPQRYYHTRGDMSGTITIIVYDEQSGLFDWYHHIPNEKSNLDGVRIVSLDTPQSEVLV